MSIKEKIKLYEENIIKNKTQGYKIKNKQK